MIPVLGISMILISFSGYSNAEDQVQNWTLAQVKKIAVDHNPDLLSARANYEAATKGIGVALSGYLPHVTVSGQYENTTLPNPSAGSTAQLGIDLPYSMVTASVNQTIFDFGKTLSRISVNRAQSSAAEQDAFSVRNAVTLAVEKAFYNVESSAQLVDVAERGLKKYLETFRMTEVLVKTGTRPRFDLTQANVEVAKAKFAVNNAENISVVARIALLDLMGLQDQPKFKLIDQGTPEEFAGVETSKLNLDRLVQRALQLRPEIKRQEFSFQAARSEFSENTKNYFPKIYLQGWVGKYLPDYPTSITDSWGVGVGLTWHVFDGLETTFRAGQLAAIADSQEALIDKNKLVVTGDVTRGFQGLVRSEENLKVAEESLTAAKENLQLAQKRYDVNVATILELLVAENSQLNAEANSVSARFDHEIALATLEKAVNGPLKE